MSSIRRSFLLQANDGLADLGNREFFGGKGAPGRSAGSPLPLRTVESGAIFIQL
jgi:hypothetical protein